jgi:hypothetical protein
MSGQLVNQFLTFDFMHGLLKLFEGFVSLGVVRFDLFAMKLLLISCYGVLMIENTKFCYFGEEHFLSAVGTVPMGIFSD